MFNTGGIVMSKYRILVKGIVKKDNKFLIVERWYDDNIAAPYQCSRTEEHHFGTKG